MEELMINPIPNSLLKNKIEQNKVLRTRHQGEPPFVEPQGQGRRIELRGIRVRCLEMPSVLVGGSHPTQDLDEAQKINSFGKIRKQRGDYTRFFMPHDLQVQKALVLSSILSELAPAPSILSSIIAWRRILHNPRIVLLTC